MQGNEVERQGKTNHGTLLSRRAFYQLSYQGNSAGRGWNLQHNTTQRHTSNHCAMAQYTLTQYVGADEGN